MTGLPQFNFPAFMQAEDKARSLWEGVQGLKIHSPARVDMERGFVPWSCTGHEDLEDLNGFEGIDRIALMRENLNAVLDSDLVLLLNGWEMSTGASAEVATAQSCGIPIYRWGRVPNCGAWMMERL